MRKFYRILLVAAALIICGSAFAQDPDPVKQKMALDPVVTESGIVQVVVKINENFSDGGTDGRGDFGIIAHDETAEFDNWDSGLALAIINYNNGSPILRGWNGALDTWATDEKSLNLGESFSLWFDMDVVAGTYSIYVQGENDADVALLGEENMISRAVSKDYTPRDNAAHLTVAVNRAWNDLTVIDIIKEAEVVDVIEPYFIQVPFLGAPVSLPGTIMAVEYDKGGQNISYFDTSEENRGVAMREIDFRVDEWVDIDNHPDGGYIIGWTADGEWVEYTVLVTEAGMYNIEFHTASRNGGGLIGIDVDGETLLSGISVPKTDDWNVYSTLTQRVHLKEGRQVWRVNIEKAGFNIHKLVVNEYIYPGPQGIFTDDFGQEPVSPIVSSGDPMVDYTIWTTVDSLELGGGTALIEEYAPGDGMLKLLAREDNNNQSGNRTEVSAPLSAYNEPFNPILSLNEDTLVWAFTARQWRNSAGGGHGFNGTNTGMAVVLASDSTTWGSQQGSNAKGYAVTILKPDTDRYSVSLSRFDGGLSAYTVIAGSSTDSIIEDDFFSDYRTWVTVKVRYIPATNEWSLYFRDEESQTTKGDVFDDEGLRLIGTVVDDTFTDLEMTHFGFALNTPAPGAAGAGGNAFWVDDFMVALGNIVIEERYTLTVNAGTGGAVSKSPDQIDYLPGSQVEITAIPDEGYEFVNWLGGATGSENPLTVTVNSDMTIAAIFALIPPPQYTLDITSDNGTVNQSIDGTEFDEGTEVELTAIPDEGFEFESWSGDVVSTDNPVMVTMDSNKDITANFTIKTYTLTITAENGQVNQSIDGTEFDHGTQIELTAVPDEGFEFESWSGDVVSTDNPVTVTMDSNTEITANFTLINFIRESELALSVFPNPSVGIFSVQTSQPISFKVYNLNGVLVKAGKASESFTIDLSAFNNAIYILQVKSQEGVSVKRIMKVSE